VGNPVNIRCQRIECITTVRDRLECFADVVLCHRGTIDQPGVVLTGVAKGLDSKVHFDGKDAFRHGSHPVEKA